MACAPGGIVSNNDAVRTFLLGEDRGGTRRPSQKIRTGKRGRPRIVKSNGDMKTESLL